MFRPTRARKLTDLLLRIETCDREAKRVNSEKPFNAKEANGDGYWLLESELVAPGLDHFRIHDLQIMRDSSCRSSKPRTTGLAAASSDRLVQRGSRGAPPWRRLGERARGTCTGRATSILVRISYDVNDPERTKYTKAKKAKFAEDFPRGRLRFVQYVYDGVNTDSTLRPVIYCAWICASLTTLRQRAASPSQ
jgi:hypothetical protein